MTVPSEARAQLPRNFSALPGPRGGVGADVVVGAVCGDEAVAGRATHEGSVRALSSLMSVVAVIGVVGSMGMTWSCIAVLSELLRGCIEVVLEHR